MVKMGTAMAYLELDTSKFSSALSSAVSMLSDFGKNAESISGRIGSLGENTKSFARELAVSAEDVKKAMEQQSESIKEVANTYEQQSEKISEEAKEAFDDVNKAQEKTAEEAEKTSEKFSESWKQASENILGIGDKIVAIGNNLTSVGKKLTKNITTPIVGIGTAAVKSFSSFESTLSKVQAISGATADDVERLKERASELGASTKFSATEVAEGFTYMSMAGWKTEDMLKGIDGILSLAAADGLDLATTSDIVTDALTAFGLGADQAGHFADVLAAAASNANTNVSMMGESFKYAGAIAGTMGYSVEDIALSLGLMANNGIKASQAGTSLRASITRMSSPMKQGREALEKLGLWVNNTNTAMYNADGTAKSLSETLDILRDAFAGLSQQEQLAAAKAIFGQEAMAGMLAIINTTEEDYNSLADAINNAGGAAQTMQEKMLDNLSGSLQILKSAAEGALNAIGEIITPMVRKVVDSVTDLITKFNELDKAQQTQIVKIGAIAAAVGPAMLAFGGLVSNVGKVVVGFEKLGVILKTGTGLFAGMTAPVLAVVAAITALTAAFAYLYKTNDEFKAEITAIVERFKELGASIWETVQPALVKLGEAFKKLWEDLQPLIELLGKVFVTVINTLLDAIENLTPAFEPLIGFIGGLIEQIGGIIGAVTAIITGDTEAFNTAVQHLVDGTVEMFTNGFKLINAVFTGLVDSIKDGAKNIFLGIFEDDDVAVQAENAAKRIDEYSKYSLDRLDTMLETARQRLGEYERILLKGQTSGEFDISIMPDWMKKAYEQSGKDLEQFLSDNIADIERSISEYTTARNNALKSIQEGYENATGTYADAMAAAGKAESQRMQEYYQTIYGTGKQTIEAINEISEEEAEAVKTGSTKVKTELELAMDALERQYKRREIDEAEYNKRRLDYLNANRDEESDEWAKYYDQVMDYYERLSDTEKKAAEKANTERKKTFENMLNSYKTAMENIKKNIETFSNKLKGSLKDYFTFGKDWDGNIVSARITDKMTKQIKELEDYQKQLEKFTKRNVGQSFLTEIAGMDKDEGIAALKELNSLTDEQLKNLEKRYNKIGETSKKIGDMLYSDETKKVTESMSKTMSDFIAKNEDFKDIGLQMVEKISEGLLEGTQAGTKFSEAVNSLADPFKDGLFQNLGYVISSIAANPTIPQSVIAPTATSNAATTAAATVVYSGNGGAGLSKADIVSAIKEALPNGNFILKMDERQIAIATRKQIMLLDSEAGV